MHSAPADEAPVMIWQAGPDKLAMYFNRPWLEFTGRSLEQEAGTGWAEGVHAGDRERCLATYEAAFDARRDFEMEYRLRRHDGQYRWVVDRGRPLYDAEGEFLGYIGGCFDITDRKQRESDRQVEILDDVLQTFFVIGLVSARALADMSATRVTEPSGAALTEILDLAATGTARLRNVLLDVEQPTAAKEGYVRSLRRLVQEYQRRTGIKATLVVSGSEALAETLPAAAAERLHAIGAEALSFIERSSMAHWAVLELRFGRRGVTLSIQDNTGFASRTRLPLTKPPPR